MPIVGFNCPICKMVVAVDHYAVSDCGLKLPADYATAVLRANDERYVSGEVTVTMGLGCPRSRAIEADLPVKVNPLQYNALLIGRAWDSLLEKYAPENTAKVQVDGTIEGIHIYGEIDRMVELDGKLYIADHKHSNNFAQKFAREGGVKTEYRIQTSIYAELYAQKFGKRPHKGLVFNHYSGAPTISDDITRYMLPFVYDFMPLAECLDHKPYGGDWTVLQLYQQANVYCQWKKGGAVRMEALELPLAGETMSFGSKSFCDYCQVQNTCFEHAKGAPF